MRREQGVLSGICRKYQDRDDIKDGNKCLQALDDLIAEVSAKLEEYKGYDNATTHYPLPSVMYKTCT